MPPPPSFPNHKLVGWKPATIFMGRHINTVTIPEIIQRHCKKKPLHIGIYIFVGFPLVYKEDLSQRIFQRPKSFPPPPPKATHIYNFFIYLERKKNSKEKKKKGRQTQGVQFRA